MTGSAPPPPPPDPRGLWSLHPGTRAVVARTDDGRRAQEFSLVLRAIGIAHRVEPFGPLYELVVHPRDAWRAGEQLRRYVEENRAPPEPAHARPPRRAVGLRGAFAAVVLLVLVDRLSASAAFGLDWDAAGRADAALIREGQVFRAATALTLHTGAPHLAGNAVFGAVFVSFTAELLGNGVALTAIVLTGVLGNLTNAWIQSPEHLSVGASTAVFGALGLLVAQAWTGKRRAPRWMQRWAPVVFGLALLGYLGTEGERTDVAAHVLGFLAGCGLGVPLALWSQDGPRPLGTQLVCGLSGAALVFGAWWWALATAVASA
ncbi:MAG: rhomboid family intramembrane serine protease [Planctomycetes bacterium]|nr:rhomboid family intramembrane serine protease [Planctomycetota bacterium]